MMHNLSELTSRDRVKAGDVEQVPRVNACMTNLHTLSLYELENSLGQVSLGNCSIPHFKCGALLPLPSLPESVF